jgi:3-hydroxymyristoyl/3-hydroxydecanoyl-(acyl carrier protein) dehydratase
MSEPTRPNIPVATPELPQTAPFRLLDRVLHVDFAAGVLHAVRRLSSGDALWPAELPAPQGVGAAAFPEVLIIEALCQAAACLNSLELGRQKAPSGGGLATGGGSHHGYLVAITDFRFPDRAYLGETLFLSVDRQSQGGPPGSGLGMVAFAVRALALDGAVAVAELATGNDPASGREVASGRLLFAVRAK